MSDPRTKLVGAGYDAMVDTWETWSAQISDDPRAEWLDKLTALLPAGGSVLELGCGGGTAREPAARRPVHADGRRSLDGAAAARAGANPERRVPPRRPRHHRVRRPARSTRSARSTALNHVPRELLGGLFAAGASWLRPGGVDARLARRRRPGRLGGRMARRADVLLELPGRRRTPSSCAQPVSTCWRTRSSASTSRKVLSSSSGSSPGDELRLLARRTTASCCARRSGGGYRFAGFDRPPEPGDLILRHDVDLSLDGALARRRGRGGRGRLVDLVPDDAVGLLQPRLAARASRRSRACASSATASRTTPSSRTSTSTSASSRSSPGTTRIRSTCARRSPARPT